MLRVWNDPTHAPPNSFTIMRTLLAQCTCLQFCRSPKSALLTVRQISREYIREADSHKELTLSWFVWLRDAILVSDIWKKWGIGFCIWHFNLFGLQLLNVTLALDLLRDTGLQVSSIDPQGEEIAHDRFLLKLKFQAQRMKKDKSRSKIIATLKNK